VKMMAPNQVRHPQPASILPLFIGFLSGRQRG
jgi:hypothetical protein